MKLFVCLTIFIFCLSLLSIAFGDTENDPTVAPIIGILTQESELDNVYHKLSGSFVHFVQAAGGRVVPIFIDRKRHYYEKMFKYINGLIFPGSWGVKLDINYDYFAKSGYTRAAKIMFQLAKKAYDEEQDYFPILGSCNGFQLMVYLAANETNLFGKCDTEDFVRRLDFVDYANLKNTKMFKDMPEKVRYMLKTEDVSYQYHNNCLTETNFTKAGLNEIFNIVATNKDRNNKEFITLLEGKKYPFYSMFIHPESVMDSFNNPEYNYCKSSPTSKSAYVAAQYFARWFVYEARKSTHKFPNKKMERQCVIYNFNKNRKYTPYGIDCSPTEYSFRLRPDFNETIKHY